MAARKTHIAPVLTMHRGGTDPEAKEAEAIKVLIEVAAMMPASEDLRTAVLAVAYSLRLQRNAERFGGHLPI